MYYLGLDKNGTHQVLVYGDDVYLLGKGPFINYVRFSTGGGIGKISTYSYFGGEGVKPILT